MQNILDTRISKNIRRIDRLTYNDRGRIKASPDSASGNLTYPSGDRSSVMLDVINTSTLRQGIRLEIEWLAWCQEAIDPNLS